MSETFPRWGLADVDFLEVDAAAIESQIISTYESIAKRSLAQGDPVRLFLMSLAAVISQLSQSVNLAARQNLLTYATGENLEALGYYLDTYRLAAQGAKTNLKFTLNAAQDSVYVIPQGTKVSDGGQINVFTTDEIAQIPVGQTEITVSATCMTVGTTSNGLPIGSLTILVDPLPSISSVINTDVTSGGSEVESDEALAERIKLAPSKLSVAGPHDAYVYHALSYSPSIIDVSVYGKDDTPGVVYIHPLLEGGVLPQSAFLTGLKEFLSGDTIRPLTDTLSVTAATASNYKINFTWYLSTADIDKIAQITEQVTQAAETYRLWQQSKNGRDINPDYLIQLLKAAGAKRVLITTPVFTKLEKNQVAQCSADTDVTITYGGAEDE